MATSEKGNLAAQFLNERSVLSYVTNELISNGLINEQDIIQRKFKLINVSRRNRNFIVTIDGDMKFVKLPGLTSDAYATIENEISFYEWAQDQESANQFETLIPRALLCDQEKKLLVLKYTEHADSFLKQTRSLEEKHEFAGACAVIGKQLARLHGLINSGVEKEKSTRELNLRPWVFRIYLPNPAILVEITGAQLEVIKLIQKNNFAAGNLSVCDKHWDQQEIVHGDLRWDNILWLSEGSSSVKFVDWELVSRGNAIWDLAWFCADGIANWIDEQHPTRGDTASSIFERAGEELEVLQEGIRSFWAHYQSETTNSLVRRKRMLELLPRYVAAALVQRSLELCSQLTEVPNEVYLALQIAINLSEEPDRMGFLLLRIPHFYSETKA